jgi:uncharacterized membrane protein
MKTITDTFGIVTVLLFIEGTIFYLSEHRSTRKLFDFLPSMFWIYFLPMIASTLHLIPQKNEVYSFISTNFLPASLLLLLISVDIRAILKLGKVAILMMLAGSAGIVLGGPIVLLVFKPWLPAGIWSGFGALSASWTGGSANMLAVKEGLGTPEKIFLPMVVVDTIVPYVWMGLLIALSGFQGAYDRWNRSDTSVMEQINKKFSLQEKRQSEPLSLKHTTIIFAVAFLGTFVCAQVAGLLPEVKGKITAYTWTIILVTTLSLLLSFTKIKRLESYGASKIGFGLLYFVLASIGARASLSDIKEAPILIAAGFVWVLIHGLFIFGASRLLRAPLFLCATASQANVGGVASTPVVAAIYQPALAPVGLLLAILGNIMGTYMGILCGHLCRWVSGP